LKVYLIGDQKDAIEDAAEELSEKGLGVIAKEVKDEEELSKEVEDSIKNGYVFVIVKDPIKANISLNKINEINAAQCNGKYDVELAKYNNVNVIIINDASKKEEIIDSFFESFDIKKQEKAKSEEQKLNKKRIKGYKEIIEKVDEISKEDAKIEEGEAGEVEDKDQNESKGTGQGKKGFLSSIKDALGIE
jgi:ribose 5-phosphate isomerase RpiB